MRIFFNLIFISIIFNCCRNNESNIDRNLSNDDESAMELISKGDLEGAMKKYQKMLVTNPKSFNYNYNYACLFSKVKRYDSSFKYLKRAIQIDTLDDALTDPDFLHLREDKNWSEFEDSLIYKLNLTMKRPIKDIDYAKKLWKMRALDQAYYDELEIAEKEIGMNSSVAIAIWDLKDAINDRNQKELIKLIEQNGWPKISDVGDKASSSAFLIIQHSDLQKQEKYLPIIKTLCEQEEANWADYALMYDRIQTKNHKAQKYGSQIIYNSKTNSYELYPLEDNTKVDKWRKEMGLIPLKNYVKKWNIELDTIIKK